MDFWFKTRSPLAGSIMICEPRVESWLDATTKMYFQPECESGMAISGDQSHKIRLGENQKIFASWSRKKSLAVSFDCLIIHQQTCTVTYHTAHTTCTRPHTHTRCGPLVCRRCRLFRCHPSVLPTPLIPIFFAAPPRLNPLVFR